ncbi:MAG: RIP metalloprotease RseP [Rhodothermales bacterium]|nr:RIP metalloprotease RseP [Rhodothermales bacterium]
METVIEILEYFIYVLLAIMVLVFVHEMGHFLFAKLFKMRVERFSVGFPPVILGKKFGETEYVIGATPLGGYVKISGMVDESMDNDFAESPPQPWEFRSKPVWQRIVVITAGVIFNIILAGIIFVLLKVNSEDVYIPAENISNVYVTEGSLMHDIGLRTGDRLVLVNGEPLERFDDFFNIEALTASELKITVERDGEQLTFTGPPDIMTQLNRLGSDMDIGVSYLPPLIGGVVENTPASEAGLQAGDRIVRIDSTDVMFWQQMSERIQDAEGLPITLTWIRPDSLEQPVMNSDTSYVVDAGFAAYTGTVSPTEIVTETGTHFGIGIYDASGPLLWEEFGLVRNAYTPGEAVVGGITDTWVHTKLIITGLSRMISGRENLRENMGGPIAIAKVTKQAADHSWAAFWRIVAILSITLAIVNILPIPALDGGHLMFLIYEGITRREPSFKLRMIMQNIGMLVLFAFMAFLILNDILRL